MNTTNTTNTTKARNHAAPGAEQDTSIPATPSADASAQPQAQATAIANTAADALVLAPAPDPHHGKGGLYRLVNGQRELVHQTQADAAAG